MFACQWTTNCHNKKRTTKSHRNPRFFVHYLELSTTESFSTTEECTTQSVVCRCLLYLWEALNSVGHPMQFFLICIVWPMLLFCLGTGDQRPLPESCEPRSVGRSAAERPASSVGLGQDSGGSGWGRIHVVSWKRSLTRPRTQRHRAPAGSGGLHATRTNIRLDPFLNCSLYL